MKRKLAALEKVDANLTNLQYKIKKDPQSYENEFILHYKVYENQREILLQAPENQNVQSLKEHIDFISHVADCYPSLTKSFPDDLIDLVQNHHQSLEVDLREKVIGCLVLLRRKNVLNSMTLFNTLFPILVSTSSKSLRTLLFQKILSDIRNSNTNTTNHPLNRTIQNRLFTLVTEDRASTKALWAVRFARELWRRQIWTEAKAVEIMKEAALSDVEKVIVGSVQFFMGGDREREELQEESSDEEAIDLGKMKHQMAINKRKNKKLRMMDNAVASVKRKERRQRQPHPLNFSAFHLLHDSQDFADKLFHKHLQSPRSKLKLDQKLLALQLISRLVGLHKLTITSLYSYFLRYLTPRQPLVTTFLACLAQATHNQVPPDALEPLVQKIANEFVSEAAAAQVASAGLNAIREICARQPLVMSETLLQDLVMYRKSKDKGVVMAAKGLLSLYREVGPHMLKRRDRGRDAAISLQHGERKTPRFGEEAIGEIEGLDLLAKWREEEKARQQADQNMPEDAVTAATEEDSDGWEVDSAQSDKSGGWINVESDQDIKISDSEDDKPAPKRTKEDDGPPQYDENKENQVEVDSASTKTMPNLATSKILTPADLAKLKELRLSASLNQHLPASQRKRAAKDASRLASQHADDALTAAEIEGLASLSSKATKAEKVAKAKENQADRSEHKSTGAIRKQKKAGKSSTNKEKERKKNFLMTLGKGKAKGKRSLVQQKRILKAHVERGKKGGRKGNRK